MRKWIDVGTEADWEKNRHRSLLAYAQRSAADQGKSTAEWVDRQRLLAGWRVHPWIDGYLTQDFDRMPQ
jgi:hypothetical protein